MSRSSTITTATTADQEQEQEQEHDLDHDPEVASFEYLRCRVDHRKGSLKRYKDHEGCINMDMLMLLIISSSQ
jgi:hypothetical protein